MIAGTSNSAAMKAGEEKGITLIGFVELMRVYRLISASICSTFCSNCNCDR